MSSDSTILTKTIPAQAARTQFGQILELTRSKKARFVVSKNGEPAAIILGIEDYLESVIAVPEALEALQAAARKRGLDLLSLADIDEEIAKVRTKKRGRKQG